MTGLSRRRFVLALGAGTILAGAPFAAAGRARTGQTAIFATPAAAPATETACVAGLPLTVCWHGGQTTLRREAGRLILCSGVAPEQVFGPDDFTLGLAQERIRAALGDGVVQELLSELAARHGTLA